MASDMTNQPTDETGEGPDSATLAHRYVTVNGIRIHYVEAGSGPLVILLHGFPSSWYCWRHQIAALSPSYRVIAPDLRGYNETDAKGPFDLETLQRDVIGLIEAAGEKDAHIVGHDWGGAVAWALAIQHPEVARSLAVCNIPHPVIFQKAVRRNPRQMLRSWYFLFFQIPWLPEKLLSTRGYRRLLDSIVDQCRPGTFSDDDQQVMLSHWRRQGLAGGVNWYRAVVRHPPRLPEPTPIIQAPTILIWGEGDAFLGRELTEGTDALVANLDIHYLPGISHWVMEEAANEVNGLLLNHLKRADESNQS